MRQSAQTGISWSYSLSTSCGRGRLVREIKRPPGYLQRGQVLQSWYQHYHRVSHKDANACHSSSLITIIVESRSAGQFGSKASKSCSQMNESLSNISGLGLSQGLLSQRLQLLTNCKGIIAQGCGSTDDSVHHESNKTSCKNFSRACMLDFSLK